MVFVISALRGGGAEKFVLNLYKAMEKYQGYECHIVAIEKAVEHDIDGYRVHFVNDFCNVSKKGLRRLLYKKNIAESVDEYIKRNISKDAFVLSNMLLADKIMSKSKLRVCHVIHNSYRVAFLSGKSLLKKEYLKRKINRTYRNHPLTFVSQSACLDYQSSFLSKFESTVIYNPIELDDINKKSLIPINDEVEGPYFIHIGRFNRQKRQDLLIKAFANMKDKKLKLLLIGEGGLIAEAKELVRSLGIENRVIFKGFVTNPYPYLEKAKGFVLSSDFEGLPTVLIEAIALGTPVVTTDCNGGDGKVAGFSGGVSEILENNLHVITPCKAVAQLARMMDDMSTNPNNFHCTLPPKFMAKEVSEQYHALDLSH